MFASSESVGNLNETPRTRSARTTTEGTPELGHPLENLRRHPGSWHHFWKWAERRAHLTAKPLHQLTTRAAPLAGSTLSPPPARSNASTDKGRDRPPGSAQGLSAQPQPSCARPPDERGQLLLTPDPLNEPNLRNPMICQFGSCKDLSDVNAFEIDPLGEGAERTLRRKP